jgi:hypothetical protein
MDQQNQPPQGGVPGPTGRRLHIAHRRSPSELTPLMSMFSSPGSKLFGFSMCSQAWPVVIEAPAPQHRNITDKHLYSGTTCDSATNRTASATTAADPGYPPAIRQHGHDPSHSTPRTRRRVPHTATDAESIPTKCLSVPQPDATTATDECPDGCSYTTVITSP